MPSALVLGGAGFIGSSICRHLIASGWSVTAIDGLMPKTGGDRANITEMPATFRLIPQRVEEASELPDVLLRGNDLIVDAMGWTSHWQAYADPAYDLALNLASHVAVVCALPKAPPRLLVYLGSRIQYGLAKNVPISETEPLSPVDIQGIHKTAAEHHYRLAAERHGITVVSLRFGNTIGPAMPLQGPDVGLVGEMLRQALAGGTIKVFGSGRRRTVHYAPDLARIITNMAGLDLTGFLPINVPGDDVAIADLARQIQSLAGGNVAFEPLPAEVAALDASTAPLDCSRFERLFGSPRLTPLPEALAATAADACRRMNTLLSRI